MIFKLRQSNHPRFRRDGDDLHYEMHLTLKEALLGFSKTVRHLDGRDVALQHKGVTQPFQVRKVRTKEGELPLSLNTFPMSKLSHHLPTPPSHFVRRWRARACRSTTTRRSTVSST